MTNVVKLRPNSLATIIYNKVKAELTGTEIRAILNDSVEVNYGTKIELYHDRLRLYCIHLWPNYEWENILKEKGRYRSIAREKFFKYECEQQDKEFFK